MQSKIRRVSFLFRVIFQISFIIVPLVHIADWIYAPEPIFFLGQNSGIIFRVIPESIQILAPLSLSTKLLGFLVSAIPVIMMELILYFLIKLFYLYERGEIFALTNVNYIKKTGYALLALQLLKPICEGILTAVVTWHNPHGYRVSTVTLSGIDVTLLLSAFLIILIGWIMAEGCRLREEQRLTI